VLYADGGGHLLYRKVYFYDEPQWQDFVKGIL
jgi:hypothetical protein